MNTDLIEGVGHLFVLIVSVAVIIAAAAGWLQ